MTSKHFYLLFIFLITNFAYSQIGIGTITPDENALLEVASNSQGILIPRMTKAQRDAIPVTSGSKGLLIYQTDNTEGFYFYNGAIWSSINPTLIGSNWSTNGDDIYNNNLQYVGVGTGSTITTPLHVKSTSSSSTSTTETVPLYQNNFTSNIGTSSGSGCDWSIISGQAVNDVNCNPDTNQTLSEGPISPATTTVAISFDYEFHSANTMDLFEVILYNTTTGTNHSTFINITADASASYSSSITLMPGNTYQLNFRHVGKKNQGGYAHVDNILVTEEITTVVSVPAIAFRLEDGTQGEGNILTSDADGNAYWVNAMGEPGPIAGDNDWVMVDDLMYNGNSGDIGIGTTFPTTKLYIEDNIASAPVVYVENTNASSSESYGVYGATYATNATGAAGVFGESDYGGDHEMGVKGKINNQGAAIAGIGFQMSDENIAIGKNYGVWGAVNSQFGVGVYAWSIDLTLGPDDYAYGLYVDGDFAESNSTKSGSVPTTQGNQLVYSVESPEIWFKDYGSATLLNGEVHIDLGELFQETVFVDGDHPMHVRVQEQGNSNGLFVIPDEDGNGFTVKEKQDGTSNIAFSYKITAKRRFYQDHRFGVDPNQPFENNLIKTKDRKPASTDPEIVRQQKLAWIAKKNATVKSTNKGK